MGEGWDDPPWKQITLFLLTLGAVVLCGFLLYPFASALVGAIVLAVITQQPYDWLAKRIRNRNACAAVAVILVVLAVIVPGFFLAQNVGEQALEAVTSLRSDAFQQKISDFIANRPAGAALIQSATDSIDVPKAARASASYLGVRFARFLGSSIHVITQLVVMVFLLFFLYRDRSFTIEYLRTLLPLREGETEELIERIGDTIYATALGRLIIAAVQGVLAGLGFWVLGVPGVILWAAALMAFAMIPAFGAFLVWGPIAIYLGLTGHWGKAALLAVWGGVIVSTIDNILYPILVGSHLRAHTVTILISILGGIAVFGVTGIVLGPVAFTIAGTLLGFWRRRTIAESGTT